MAGNGNQKRLKGQHALLVALASGRTVKEAAAAAGIAERTAHRRLEDTGTRTAIRQLRAQMVAQATGGLAAAMSAAVAALVAIVESGESEQNRLSASRAVLDIGSRFYEQHELLERLERLEALVEHQAGNVTTIRRTGT